jgi:hypothetical protein
MRKTALVSLVAVALLFVGATPSHAWNNRWHGGWHGGTRVFIGVGPGFWWGAPYPYWGYYPPAYYYPPPVVVQEPPVYVSQPQPAPAPEPSQQGYWYYCSSAKAYYPNVQSCPEAWIKVPPRTE